MTLIVNVRERRLKTPSHDRQGRPNNVAVGRECPVHCDIAQRLPSPRALIRPQDKADAVSSFILSLLLTPAFTLGKTQKEKPCEKK